VNPDRAPLEGSLLFAVRCFAGIRLGFVAIVLLARPSLPRSTVSPDHLDAVLDVVGVYATVLVALAAVRPAPLVRWPRLGLIDLVALGGLVVYSGGTHSPLRFAYFAVPFLVAFVARPATAVRWSLGTLAGYLAVVPIVSRSGVAGIRPLELTGLLFAAVGGITLSEVLVRLQQAVTDHAARASALAGEVIRVEARERRALADALHDGALQQISIALREISATPSGEDDNDGLEQARVALEQALDQLRGEIFTLYPHILEHAGLNGAVDELVRRAADRGGFAGRLRVDAEAAGIDDLAVVAVLRELLTNAAKHAGAAEVDVCVSNPTGSCVVVEVSDDGRGFAPPSSGDAVRGRQFGLQAAADRLRAVGGSLELRSAPGAGTSATAWIPARRGHISPATPDSPAAAGPVAKSASIRAAGSRPQPRPKAGDRRRAVRRRPQPRYTSAPRRRS
jgi:two-component system NarL family sensor kinase